MTVAPEDVDVDFRGTPRFHIQSRIGEGGMGVVYAAHDTELGARVALKTLRSLAPDSILRLKHEFRALHDLQHPNLVALGELIEAGGQWFFTMELIEGVHLLRWVRPADETPRRLDEPRCRAAFGQLALGLRALHAARKVHRDIKPSNTLVTLDGRVVILDFGLITEVQAPDAEGHAIGTASYMAPEQAASLPVGPAADWYAVGVMLYQALTGRLPISGTPHEVLAAKQHQVPERPSALAPNVPPDLDQLCVELLSIHPLLRPTDSDVLRRLGVAGSDDDEPPRAVAQAPFVGREPELEALAWAFSDTRAGTPVTVVLEGESGVGKTALVRRFVELVERDERDAVVLAGRCFERESVPYKAFDGAIDALAHYLAALPAATVRELLPPRAPLLAQIFPSLRRLITLDAEPAVADPQEQRTRVFAALRELFRRVAARHPLVIAIDDFQWADADSLALLTEMLRPPDAPVMLVAATTRLAGDANLAHALPGEVRHVRVEALPPADARTLVSFLIGSAVPRGQLEQIAGEAGGHPLFIDELVRRYASDESRRVTWPVSLVDALGARLAELEAPAQRLVETVALAGVPITQEIAARATEMTLAQLSRVAASLRSANLVRTTGARPTDLVEPYHDRVRQAALARLDRAAAARGHRQLALALESAGGGDAEALAVHWRGAGERARAARHALDAAARAAEALAFDRAARLYRLALELAPPTGDAGQALWTHLGDALTNAGRGPEAAAAFRTAAGFPTSQVEAWALERRAAEQLLRSGHIDEGLAGLRKLLDAVRLPIPRSPRRALLSLLWRRARLRLRGYDFRKRAAADVAPGVLSRIDLCWAASIGMALVDPVRGAGFQARATLEALRAGEPHRIARVIAAEVGYAALAGGPARARTLKLVELGESLAQQIDDMKTRGLVTVGRGMAMYHLGLWKRAREAFAAGETILRERCTGADWELDASQIFHMEALFFLGELGELARRGPAQLRRAEERGDLYAAVSLRSGASNAVWLVRDDAARARSEATLAIERWSRTGFHVQHFYDLAAQLRIDLYTGDGAAAMARVADRFPALAGSLLLRCQSVRIKAWQMQAQAALAHAQGGGDRAALARLVDKNARRIEKEAMPWSTPMALLLRGGAAALRRESEAAGALYAQAALGFSDADMALYAAVARRRQGQQLAGAAGRALIDGADQWMVQQGIVRPSAMAAALAP